jgi:hypothetical protein
MHELDSLEIIIMISPPSICIISQPLKDYIEVLMRKPYAGALHMRDPGGQIMPGQRPPPETIIKWVVDVLAPDETPFVLQDLAAAQSGEFTEFIFNFVEDAAQIISGDLVSKDIGDFYGPDKVFTRRQPVSKHVFSPDDLIRFKHRQH